MVGFGKKVFVFVLSGIVLSGVYHLTKSEASGDLMIPAIGERTAALLDGTALFASVENSVADVLDFNLAKEYILKKMPQLQAFSSGICNRLEINIDPWMDLFSQMFPEDEMVECSVPVSDGGLWDRLRVWIVKFLVTS